MKPLVAILILVPIFLSFHESRDQNYWVFSRNETKLIEGNTFRDTTIIINVDSLYGDPIYAFNFLLCGGNNSSNFTECYLTTKDSVRYITSALESGQGIAGYISGKRFIDILNDSKQTEFVFESKFRGIEFPLKFFKIKVIK